MKRKWKIQEVLDESSNYTSSRKNNFFSSTPKNNILGDIEEIEIKKIISEENPRRIIHNESILELAENIRNYGLLQPITVRKKGPDYFLIAGERRLRAFQALKRTTIPSIIKSVDEVDPEKIPIVKLIENIQREDLHPADLANGLLSMKNRTGKTNKVIAKDLNKSEQWVKARIHQGKMLVELKKTEKKSEIPEILRNLPFSIFNETVGLPDKIKILILKKAALESMNKEQVRKLVQNYKSGNGSANKAFILQNEIELLKKKKKAIEEKIAKKVIELKRFTKH